MAEPTLLPIQTPDGSKRFVTAEEAISSRDTAMQLIEQAMSELSVWYRKWESVLSSIEGNHPTEATKACAEVVRAIEKADQVVREAARQSTKK
jgi:hypothetical protein